MTFRFGSAYPGPFKSREAPRGLPANLCAATLNVIGAGLINREVIDGRNKYRTNTAAIRRLSQRMLQVLDDR